VTTTVTRVDQIPAIDRHEAATIAATEYQRFADLLRELDTDDWRKPTDCPEWDVRAMAGHTLGMMRDFSSLANVMRRTRAATKAAKAAGGPVIDSMTAMQVEATAALTTDELIAQLTAAGPGTARWRTKSHPFFRTLPLHEEVGGRTETWRMSYLLDVVLTRDPWMHRVDITRATGRAIVHTAEHDGRIVADVVAEWARRHGKPFRLELTGPAGGSFTQGDHGEVIGLDTVEFCRILSGRAAGTGLLTQEVPF
jgi:uncharacterized protein (TIGR03083 family)